MSFAPVWAHRFKYFLSPQLDLYKNIAAKFGAADRILDYGCGTGFGLAQLAGAAEINGMSVFRIPLGIDADPTAVVIAESVLGRVARFRKDDWCTRSEVEEYAGQFDLVTCIEVIEHVSSPGKLLKNLVASLSPGGVIVISTLNHNSSYRKNNDHRSKYNVDSFTELVETQCPMTFITDFKLMDPVDYDSEKTPIVAIWRKPLIA